MKNFLLGLCALVLLILGQPHILPSFSFAPALFAYALFFLAIRKLPAKGRFWSGFFFFFCYQISALFWLTSHPFSYAYGALIILAALFAAQFAIATIFAKESNFVSYDFLLIPAIATLFEYSRLFYFSGYALHPIGLPAAGFFVTQHIASYIGILGLTFFTLLINCLFVKAWITKNIKILASAVGLLCISYTLFTLIVNHAKTSFDKKNDPYHVLVLQEKDLPEELDNKNTGDIIALNASTWKRAYELLAQHSKEQFDFVLFPEIFISYPATSPLFSYEQMNSILTPFEVTPAEPDHAIQFSSLEIASLLSSLTKTPLVIGLENATHSIEENKNHYFNSAFYISKEPNCYDKMILLPMGEYIPFSCLKTLAAQYGMFDSFTKGKGITLFAPDSTVIAPTICYEDAFSWVGRAAAQKGAKMLVNLTNDGWFPNSTLGVLHAAHGRVRTLEEGMPLIRSCNFGTSGAYDALGNGIDLHSFRDMKESIEAFPVTCSRFTYPTLYRYLGDIPLVLLSLGLVVGLYFKRKGFPI